MKKLILMGLMLIPVLSMSQSVMKVTGTQFSYRRINEVTNKWDEWSPWEESGVLILINSKKRLINIFSDSEQEYDIINMSDEIDRGEYSEFVIEAIDEDGIACMISLIRSQSTKYNDQMIIKWNNLQIVYELEPR